MDPRRYFQSLSIQTYKQCFGFWTSQTIATSLACNFEKEVTTLSIIYLNNVYTNLFFFEKGDDQLFR